MKYILYIKIMVLFMACRKRTQKVYLSSNGSRDSFGSPISHPDLVHGTGSDRNIGPLRSTGLLALPQGSKAFCRRHQGVCFSLMDLQCFSYIMLAFLLNPATFVSRYLARGMRWIRVEWCWYVAGSTENSNSRLKAARKSSIAGSLVLHPQYPQSFTV